MAMISGVGYTDSTSMLSMVVNNVNKKNGNSGTLLTDLMGSRAETSSQLSELLSSISLPNTSNVGNNGNTNTSTGPGKVELTSFGNIGGYGQGNMTKLPKYTSSTVQFDYLSKSEPTMSDKEFEEAIKKLAEKNAAEGVYEEVGDDYYELARKYVSVVSPDRQAIIAGAPANSLVPSGLNYDVAKAYDDKGRVVATYNPAKGWSNQFTAEEKERNTKFDEIYWSAYDAYVKKHNLDKPSEEEGPSGAVVDTESEEDSKTPAGIDYTA